MSADFFPGNQVDLLETGVEFFPALVAAIETARFGVCLETYIFADDPTGRKVATALAGAALRGVRVHVLVDGFGTRNFPAGLGKILTDAGVLLETYRPEPARFKFRRHRLRRLHRKLAVIDGRIAFVGGINIIDDLNDGRDDLGLRHDYAVRITGPLVAQIQNAMRSLWRLVGWAKLQRRPPDIPVAPPAPLEPVGTVRAAFVIRDNLRHRSNIEDVYLEAIGNARETILLANAYFLPGLRFRHALCDAAARGVSVTILLQGQVEYALLHYATQALYRKLIDEGVRIHEYRTGFLHAKVAVVDNDWATVGSSNIDPFSLLLAREANVVVKDAGFAARLGTSLRHTIDTSATEITREALQRSGLLVRGLRWLAYGMVRLMLGITRYGGADYRE